MCRPIRPPASFWLKNRDPAHWRDAWQIENISGRYIVSDRTLTEDEWIKERGADVIDGEATEIEPAASHALLKTDE
jgi:hypothetical protein